MATSLLVLFIILLNSSSVSAKYLKCCDLNDILIPQINGTKNHCIAGEVSPLLPLLFPKHLIIGSGGRRLRYDGCVDKTTNGTIIKINARTQTIETNFQVENLKKCCPKREVYDFTSKRCVIGDDNLLKEIPLIVNHITNYIYQSNFCHNRFIMDILINETRLVIDHEIKRVYNLISQSDEVVDFKYSCFERALNGQIVIRTCQKTCSSSVCVRKCCEIGSSFGNLECLVSYNVSFNPHKFLSKADQADTNWFGKSVLILLIHFPLI